MRKSLLRKAAAFGLVLLFGWCAAIVSAAPYGPNGKQGVIIQDGKELPVRVYGDEFYKRIEYDGYTIVPTVVNGKKEFRYAVPRNGAWSPSAYVVGKDDPTKTSALSKRLLESDSVVRAKLQAPVKREMTSSLSRMAMEQKLIRLKRLDADPKVIARLSSEYNSLFADKGYSVNPDDLLKMDNASNGEGVFSSPSGPDYTPPPEKVIGDVKGILILVKFAGDGTPPVTREQVDLLINSYGQTALPYGNKGSAYDYFYDNSFGKLRFTSLISPIFVTLPHNKAHYDFSATGTRDFLNDAINACNDQCKGWDISSVTLEDGAIRALGFFYMGVADPSGELWPHMWNFTDAGATAQLFGRQCNYYQMSDLANQVTVGTFCHESDHLVCKVKDYYDYGNPFRYNCGDAIQSHGVGNHCLQGWGNSLGNPEGAAPARMNPYFRYKLGWANAVEVNPNFNFYDGNFSAEGDKIYIVRKNSTEYFIIENRYGTLNSTGLLRWDSAVPAKGIAIWQVDETVTTYNELQQHTQAQHFELSVVQADGRLDLEQPVGYGTGNPGDSMDFFHPGSQTKFNVNTTPAARWWDGTSSGLQISGIGSPNVTNTLMFGTVDTTKITVISPSGSEEYFVDQTMNISWFSPVAVQIDLCRGTSPIYNIATDLPADRTNFSWRIDENVPPGSEYRIRVRAMDNSLTGYSSGSFTITKEYTINVTDGYIGPGSTIISTLNVIDNPTIDKMAVRVNITAADASKLDINLLAPDSSWGTFERPLLFTGSQIARKTLKANLTNSVFDPLSSRDISSSASPFTGRFTPYRFFSSYQGKSARGAWRMTVKNSSTDTVKLNSWGVSVVPVLPKVSFVTSYSSVSLDTATTRIKLVASTKPSPGYDIQVYYTVSGTARYGIDYTVEGTFGQTTLKESSTGEIVVHTLKSSAAYDGDLTANFEITSITNGVLAPPSSHLLTMTDITAKPIVYLAVDSPMMLVPDEGAGLIPVHLRLTRATTTAQKIPIYVTGTGTNGEDFTLSPYDYATIPAGKMEVDLSLNILNNPKYFPTPRNVNIAIGNASPGTAIIEDNPATRASLNFVIRELSVPAILNFAQASVTTEKKNTRVSLTWTLSSPMGVAVKVPFTVSGNAVEGVDYNLDGARTLTIPANQSRGAITVNIIDNRQISDETKTLTLTFGDDGGVVLGTQPSSSVIITPKTYSDPVISIVNQEIEQWTGNSVTIRYNLSSPATKAVTIPVVTSGARANIDFEYFNPSVSIPVGSSSGTLTIKLLKTEDFVDSKLLLVSIHNPVNACYYADAGTCAITIFNNNPPPVLYLENQHQYVNMDATATVTVMINPAQHNRNLYVPFTVTYPLGLQRDSDYFIQGANVIDNQLKIPLDATETSMSVTLAKAYQNSSFGEFRISFSDVTDSIVFPSGRLHNIYFIDRRISSGMTDSVQATNLSYGGAIITSFAARPSIYAQYISGSKSKKASLKLAQGTVANANNVSATYKKLPSLVSQSKLKKYYEAGQSLLAAEKNASVFPQNEVDTHLTLYVKGRLYTRDHVKTPKQVFNTALSSILTRPIVTQPSSTDTPIVVTAGAQVLVRGKHFGSKPKVWLEGKKNGKTIKLNCKLVPNSYSFNPQSGAGTFTVTLPKSFAKAVSFSNPAGLVFDSKVGLTAVPVKVQK